MADGVPRKWSFDTFWDMFCSLKLGVTWYLHLIVRYGGGYLSRGRGIREVCLHPFDKFWKNGRSLDAN